MSNLRDDLLKLAHTVPETRASILAILQQHAEVPASEGVQKTSGMPAIPREFYVPPDVRNDPPLVPEGTDLAIWKYVSKTGLPGAICFAAKQNKPLWHYTFRNEANREAEIQRTIDGRKARMKMKLDRLTERKNYRHTFVVGDFVENSWGYDQTNIDFYQVTAVGEKSITIRQVSEKVMSTTMNSEYVVPVANSFIGPALKKVPQAGGYVPTPHGSATKWNGKPVYQTASGYGH